MPLIKPLFDFLLSLPRLKYTAYQADIDGKHQQFNASLKQMITQVLPITASSISIELDDPAQVNLAKIEATQISLDVKATLLANVNEFIYAASNVESLYRVLQLLKSVYHFVDYSEPSAACDIVLKLFPIKNERLDLILGSFKDLRDRYMITSNHYIEFERDTVRGMIMLLLNILPTLIYTTQIEVSNWQSQHLKDLGAGVFNVPSLEMFQDSNTVAEEWERYKPNTKSKVEILKFVDKIKELESSVPTNPAPVDDTRKTNKGHLQSISSRVTNNGNALMRYVISLIEKTPGLYSLSYTKTAAHIISENFDKFRKYPFTNLDASINVMRNTVESIYEGLLKNAPIKIGKINKQRLRSHIILAVYKTTMGVFYDLVQSKSPLAHVPWNTKFDEMQTAVVVVRLLLSQFKEEEPWTWQAPCGEMVVEGTGILKVVDESGKSIGMKAFYSPRSKGKMFKIYEVHMTALPHDVQLLEEIAAVVPSSVIDKVWLRAFLSINSMELISRTRENGNAYMMMMTGDFILPLRQQPKLTILIKAWQFARGQLTHEQGRLAEEVPFLEDNNGRRMLRELV